MSSYDLAQQHVNLIRRLVDHLLETCADRYDEVMDQKVHAVLESFESYRRKEQPSHYVRNVLHNDSPGRDYITAQCSALLKFANAVGQTARGELEHPLAPLLDA